jgi:hypothetical protein
VSVAQLAVAMVRQDRYEAPPISIGEAVLRDAEVAMARNHRKDTADA